MSVLAQQIVVDLAVLCAALWLVWSFGPESWRTALTRRRRAPAAPLHAEGLAGEPEASAPSCGPDCGCR